MDISCRTSADALFIPVCWDGDSGSCLHPCPLSDCQLLTFTSSALPGLVCSQRAPNYILISSSSRVTGKESGTGTAGTCRHTAPCWWGAPAAMPRAMGCREKQSPDFTRWEGKVCFSKARCPVQSFPSAATSTRNEIRASEGSGKTQQRAGWALGFNPPLDDCGADGPSATPSGKH